MLVQIIKSVILQVSHAAAIPLLGMSWKKMKTLIQRDIRPPKFIPALFSITEIWKQPQWSLRQK